MTTSTANVSVSVTDSTHTNVPSVEHLPVDTSLYTIEALFKACYTFTDRCYLFLRRTGPTEITVEFRARQAGTSLAQFVNDFSNELLDQRVRSDLARETTRIREWIVAQAFVEADLPGGHPLRHLLPQGHGAPSPAPNP